MSVKSTATDFEGKAVPTFKKVKLKEIVADNCLGGNYQCVEDVTPLPVMKMGNLGRGTITLGKIEYVSDGKVLSDRDVLKKGDILFNTRNTLDLVGKVAMWRGELEQAVFNSNIMRITFSENVLNEYMNYYFNSYGALKQLRARATGTTSVAAIYWRDCQNIKIQLPPLPDQKAIATLLSTWDEAIEKTERLIRAKEKRFKWLLNDLIHQGRINHTWKGYNLSDLCSPVSRKNSENNTNVLTSSAQNGLVSQLEYYNKSVSAENVTGYYLLKKGEFAYNRSSAKGYPYGATKRLDRYEKGVLSTLYLCFALKPNAPCESDFLLHLFESGAANRELRAVCQEGARSHGLLNITKSDFFGIKLFLPNQDQQKKIQSALNTAQEEIDLLKQLADKYKTQKRGLMQKILTGEWRVKPEIVNQYMEA
jgi:type I restriction enzyme S subunit